MDTDLELKTLYTEYQQLIDMFNVQSRNLDTVLKSYYNIEGVNYVDHRKWEEDKQTGLRSIRAYEGFIQNGNVLKDGDAAFLIRVRNSYNTLRKAYDDRAKESFRLRLFIMQERHGVPRVRQ